MDIIGKFTKRNFTRNRRRTIVTIIGVMLSTALICTVVGMAATFRASVIEDYKKTTGDWHESYEVNNIDQYEAIINNAHVDKAGVAQYLGFAETDVRYGVMQYISLIGCNETLFHQLNLELVSGRYPENPSEVVVAGGNANREDLPKPGDSITLKLGDRVMLADGEEIPYNGWSYAEEEVFVPGQEKTFQVVGVIQSSYTLGTSGSIAFRCFVPAEDFQGKHTQIFAHYDDPSDYSSITDGIIDTASQYGDGIAYTRNTLVMFEGGFGEKTLSMVLGLVIIISLIIVGTSIFVISNGFRISVDDKKTQFGMLASVGATKRQIRGIVLREARYIFLIGTTAGVALGALVIWILDQLVNLLIGDYISLKMIYTFPWWVILFSVVLSAATIFLAAIRPANMAARIAPIDIIRGTDELKQNAGELKAGKLSRKFFGIGGVIADKNLKRSRKKYRTTVVSLVIAVTVFIAISGFVHYGKHLVGEVYTDMDFNIQVGYLGDKSEDGGAGSRKEYDRLRGISGIRELYYSYTGTGYAELDDYGSADFKAMNGLDEEGTAKAGALGDGILNRQNLPIEILILPDEDFRDYLGRIGIGSMDPKETAVLADDGVTVDEDNTKTYFRFSSLKSGDQLEFYYISNQSYISDQAIEQGYDDRSVSMSSCRIGKVVDAEELPIGVRENFRMGGGLCLILSEKHFDKLPGDAWIGDVFIDAEDPYEVERSIDAMNPKGGSPVLRISNYVEFQSQSNRMILIMEIFLYGFILVITLIGVTNVVNTITTNMKARDREFAMLRSIGMTKKEFVGMIRAEGLLYSVRSLIIGIPAGVLLSYIIYLIIKARVDYGFIVPWSAIIISVVAVVGIVSLIMWSSVHKIRKQNIIDSIRKRTM